MSAVRGPTILQSDTSLIDAHFIFSKGFGKILPWNLSVIACII
jgi:hypothetical protein